MDNDKKMIIDKLVSSINTIKYSDPEKTMGPLGVEYR